MALGSTLPLTEMSMGFKAGRCARLTTLTTSWEPQSRGTLRACTGIALLFFLTGLPNFSRRWFCRCFQMPCCSYANNFFLSFQLSIYLSGLVTAVAVFRNPNTISFCLTTDLLLNFLFSWLLVHFHPHFSWTSSFSSFPWYPFHNYFW